MKPTYPLLVTLTVLIISQRSESSAEDPQYAACKPLQCGGLNISYPFYVPSRQPSYCGLQPFGVSCNDNNQTIINLSLDDYIINNISYEDSLVNITNSAFSSSTFHCPTSVHNLTLPGGLGFSLADSKLKHILVLQNCSTKVANSSNDNFHQIKCSENKLDVVVYEEDFKQGGFHEFCGKTVVVSYEEKEYNGSYSNIETILRKGIVVKYKANNCSHCQDSGGRCGVDNTTSELLCFCPDRPHRSSCHPSTRGKKLKIILGSVLSGGVLLLIILVIILFYKKRRKSESRSFIGSMVMSFSRARSDLDDESMKGVPVFSYKELVEATHDFDPNKELGEGGFGVVYYGKLKDGREVAVKRLYEKNYKRIEQFKNEIRILTDLQHPNLVSLYGCTTRHSRELLLVYEYICNGTVADHLHGDQAKSVLLPWSIRMKIAIETATALSYLHSNDIIHRDVKTNNILLDSSFGVKVADFGLSRLFPADMTHISTAPQGTPGYVDPEYHQCYHLTDKSDVYSFGVVLIELISSLPAVDVGRQHHEINLSNYAMSRIQCSDFGGLVDSSLGFEKDFKVRRMTGSVAELAFRCLQPERKLRPSMEEVLEALERIATADYDAKEAEETDMSTNMNTSPIMKPPTTTPSPTDNGDVEVLTRTGQQPASPVSVMDKWLNSSKCSTPETSKSSSTFIVANAIDQFKGNMDVK